MGELIPIRPSVVEPFVDASEMARLAGVSRRTVERWTAEGAPSETWGSAVRRYQPSRVLAWARERKAS